MFWNRSNPQTKAKRSARTKQGAGTQPALPEQFEFQGHHVIVQRKAFKRSISIYLNSGKPVRVVAGMSTSMEKILAFLNAKATWIDKHQSKFAEEAKKYPSKKILQSEKFPFLGAELELRFVVTPLKRAFFSRTEKALNLHLPLDKWNQLTEEELSEFIDDLKVYYKKESQSFISERIKIWAETMNLHPKELIFRNPKTRWGSCNSKGTISINWRLIGAPVEVIDYILIHELSHLQHMNHSKHFWNLVEKFCPEYTHHEKWLNEHHKALDFLI